MANQDSPSGLKPVGKIGQNADNQGMSEYQIADNEASSIFQGDPVIPQASRFYRCSSCWRYTTWCILGM